jgi:hypothetical protein
MAFTVAQLTALEEAIGAGELEVTYDGKTVKYASAEDLMKRYNFVKNALIASGLVSVGSVKRVSYAAFTKGD